jgi:hypothetical protein
VRIRGWRALEEACPDGSTAATLVTVIDGHEEEQENGTSTVDDDFLTVRLRGFDCDFNLINDNVRWRGVGRAETGTNKTSFPGFLGLFVGRRGDAVATGTVAVDGETLVDGSTDDAEMETLEDLNFSWDPPS